jgi:hypothetical protein
MHLATQLLQSRYEDTIAWEEIESDTASESTFSPKQPEEKCPSVLLRMRSCTSERLLVLITLLAIFS